uniref:Synaptotagmin XV n=1 Tax=Cyprinus carpio TaxID=7962 RepID=A0A8C2F443_CYPCA
MLFGLSVYLLWRKRRNQMLYRGLIPTTPTIPRCTTPVLQTSQSSSYGTPQLYKRKEETEEWEFHPDLHTQQGSLTAGSWFPLGSIRPDLYPCSPVVRSAYQQEREQLVVSLLHAANLPAQCQGNVTLAKLQCDTVKPKHDGKLVIRSSMTPLYVLCVIIDLGRFLIPLSLSELKDTAGKVQSRDLDSESNQPLSKNGDIQVSLNYNQSLHHLTVVLQTTVAKGNNPSFNERLTFLPIQLDTACLTLQLQQPSTDHYIWSLLELLLGIVVIGLFMYARGRELEHWNNMVSKPQELVRQWHPLGSADTVQGPQ